MSQRNVCSTRLREKLCGTWCKGGPRRVPGGLGTPTGHVGRGHYKELWTCASSTRLCASSSHTVVELLPCWGCTEGVNLFTAALLNGMSAHHLELDDGHCYDMVRPGASMIPALLPLLASKAIDGDPLLRGIEVPEMIRVAEPTYLKTSGSVAKSHGWDTTEADARQLAKQVSLVKRVIDQSYPEAVASAKDSVA